MQLKKQSLVADPRATDWIQRASTGVGRKVALGDSSKYNGRAFNAIEGGHRALEDGLKKISALTIDETRNDVLKHQAARVVAERTVAELNRSKASILTVANELADKGAELVNDALRLDPSRAQIHSETRAWIRGTAATEGGVAKVRKVMMDHSEVAAVIFQSPSFLLGVTEEVRTNLYGDAIKRFVPEAHAMLEQGADLQALAPKYDQTARSVEASFYSPELANRAASRVEV